MGNLIYKKYSPISDNIVYEFDIYNKELIDSICEKAKKVFSSWKNTSLSIRKQLLSNLLNAIDRRKQEIIDTIILDTAKTYCEAETEVIESCDILSFFINQNYEGIESFIKIDLNSDLWPLKEAYEFYQPCGVFAVIKPWNYPFELSIWAIIPLIIGGNTIVYKPSELSTATGMIIQELMDEAGFPDGTFNIIKGEAQAGKYLVENSNISGVSFTGSSITGQEIYLRCKNRNMKFSLEMGGSDFSVVLNDNIEEITLPGILWGAFSNAGQVCVSIEKLLIDNRIYKDFISKLVSETKKLCLKKEISPLISKRQYLHAKNIINMAISNGAKVLCGDINDISFIFNNGYYMMPTIIECADLDFLINLDEVFAPIMFVTSFNDEKNIPDIINSSKYGLGCSIWTENYIEHKDLIKNIDVGMIWINDVNLPMPQVPWFGRKTSGIGINLSKKSVYETMNKKVVHVDKDKKRREWWYPYE